MLHLSRRAVLPVAMAIATGSMPSNVSSACVPTSLDSSPFAPELCWKELRRFFKQRPVTLFSVYSELTDPYQAEA